MKKKINILIGLTLSAFFVYLAFRKVNLGEIIFSLKNANYLLILPNMALVILTMYIRAERWQYLLSPIRKFRPKELFPSVMIGFMANNVLPARLGEVARAYSLGAKSGESRSAIFASVVIERIFDSLSLLAMFWLVILFVPFPPAVKKFGIISLIINILLIAALMLLRTRTSWLVRLLLKVFVFLPGSLLNKMESIIISFSRGLDVFKRRSDLINVLLWSAILWIITPLANYFVFMAFGMVPNIASSFILLLFVAAAVMLPSAPGFVGIFQAATIGAFGLLNSMNLIGGHITQRQMELTSMIIASNTAISTISMGYLADSLGLYGIAKGEALSFSIILWLCQYLPVTLIGLYYLRKEHFSLTMVGK